VQIKRFFLRRLGEAVKLKSAVCDVRRVYKFSSFTRSLGHRYGAGAAPFGPAFRTRVPRPSGSDSSPLAGSGSLSKNFLSWQHGYAVTWEQRTFAPFGMCPD
jgi:hypothetical protein